MEPLSTMAIVGLAIKAINTAIQTYKDKTPDWSQKNAKQIFDKQKYLEDLYETEVKKPRYVEGEDNTNARSEDRMLNLRDQCLRHGEKVIESIRQSKG